MYGLKDYIICLYYICKYRIYKNYVRVCDFIHEQDQDNKNCKFKIGMCNCITEDISLELERTIKSSIDSTDNLDMMRIPEWIEKVSKSKCNPEEKNMFLIDDIADEVFYRSMSIPEKAVKLRNIKAALDVYICCLAITNCEFEETIFSFNTIGSHKYKYIISKTKIDEILRDTIQKNYKIVVEACYILCNPVGKSLELKYSNPDRLFISMMELRKKQKIPVKKTSIPMRS